MENKRTLVVALGGNALLKRGEDGHGYPSDSAKVLLA